MHGRNERSCLALETDWRVAEGTFSEGGVIEGVKGHRSELNRHLPRTKIRAHTCVLKGFQSSPYFPLQMSAQQVENGGPHKLYSQLQADEAPSLVPPFCRPLSTEPFRRRRSSDARAAKRRKTELGKLRERSKLAINSPFLS